MLEIVNNVKIEVVSYDDTFLVSNKEVAKTFGVGESAIRNHKMRSEYTEGKHYVEIKGVSDDELGDGTQFEKKGVTTCVGGQTRTMWTKRGIIRLGFKLQETEFTIAFRDWAEDYIIKGGEVAPQLTDAQIMANAMMIAQKTLVDMEERNARLIGANEILYNKVSEAREEIIERDKVVEYISDKSKAIKISEWAKLMFDLDGIDIGGKRLFKILRSMGYLTRGNIPMQRYTKERLFTTKQSYYTDSKGNEVSAEPTPLVTQKGIDKLTPLIRDYLLDDE